MQKRIKNLSAEQALWSARTFGNRFARTADAPAHHLADEAEELAENPEDIFEAADCFLLLLDYLWRQGFTFEDLLSAAEVKLEVNKARDWNPPDSRGVSTHKVEADE